MYNKTLHLILLLFGTLFATGVVGGILYFLVGLSAPLFVYLIIFAPMGAALIVWLDAFIHQMKGKER